MYLILLIVGILLFGAGFGSLVYWDKGRRSLVLAIRSLWLHKMRAFLSVLGIIIGTGAVITLMAFGEGSMQEALDAIRKLGATNIIVQSRKPPDNSGASNRSRVAVYGLTQADYDRLAILQEGGTVTRMVPMRIFRQEMMRVERRFTGQAVGTTPAYAEVNELPLAMGRFLRQEDMDKKDPVAVIGSRVAQGLFPFENPLGKTVKIGQDPYVIIGVLKNRMPVGDAGGQTMEDYNSDVYIPLTTCNEHFGSVITNRQAGSFQREQVALSQVTLTVSDIDKVRSTGKWIESILADHLKNDWVVSVPLDKLEAAEAEKRRFLGLLAMIAGISLVVGGIGIMNIMLATVTERTREIGIRRALGAKRRDITMQFLIEAVVQTSLGGLLGTLFGLFFAFIVPPVAQWLWNWHLPAQVTAMPIFLALIVAIVVGVGFGLYPAYRAAMLDPIEALRHE
ncbi:MAG TPA: ABC transporter permease [Gemmataceae bacterium]|nr:ABC transporter permease [Gemmataceae bacterium]